MCTTSCISSVILIASLNIKTAALLRFEVVFLGFHDVHTVFVQDVTGVGGLCYQVHGATYLCLVPAETREPDYVIVWTRRFPNSCATMSPTVGKRTRHCVSKNFDVANIIRHSNSCLRVHLRSHFTRVIIVDIFRDNGPKVLGVMRASHLSVLNESINKPGR